MGKSAIFIILYGLLAAAANFLGGLLVSSRRVGQTTLRYLIALGAGFMLATVFLKMVPESIELWAGEKLTAEAMIIPMMWFLGGYLLIQLVEHTVAPHFHFGEETHEEAMLAEHAALAGVSALMVHTFFDGVSIAAASLVDFRMGVLVFIAVLLHKLPEGFTVASMMLAAGRSRRGARVAALLVGLATLVGAALVVLFDGLIVYSHNLSSHVLPLSAGVTLYVAASDLIPEVNTREGGIKTSLMVFGGVALLYLTELILESLGGTAH
ncbi:MAG TPA: ZIP family metal transporter [Blastocatellia bacterium]|nr:ZIP family metal transporter [Blastocatellia bacterium]